MPIRPWPDFTPLSLEMRDELLPAFRELPERSIVFHIDRGEIARFDIADKTGKVIVKN